MDAKNLLTENWDKTRNALLEGLTSAQKSIVAPLLENQKKQIMLETAADGAVQAHDIAGYRRTLLPMIRRIIPGTIATEIVGVQPMKGPVDMVYSFRYVYKEAMTHDANASAFGGFDIAEGDEAFGNDKPIRQFYAGSVGAAQDPGASGIDAAGADGTSAPDDIDAATATGGAWESSLDATNHDTGTMTLAQGAVDVDGSLRGGSGSFIEGSGGRKMGLEVVSQSVEAGTRRLQAGWTVEAMQDLDSQHGLNLESEITKGLSAEIVQEIDAEIINDLLALAGTVRAFDFATTAGTTYAPAYVGDRMANIAVVINEVAQVIARKTRRMAGNFIVVSPMVVAFLQSASKSVFAPAVEGSFKGPNDTMLVGTLNGTIKVYSYLWNQARPGTSAPDGTDQILVGLKGGNGETDAGYFYCPYIPLISSGVVTNPVTFQHGISLMTRYGKVAFTDATTSLANSPDYYAKINLSNVQFV